MWRDSLASPLAKGAASAWPLPLRQTFRCWAPWGRRASQGIEKNRQKGAREEGSERDREGQRQGEDTRKRARERERAR